MFFSEDQCKNLSSELQDKLKQMEVAVFEVKHKKQIEITVVNMNMIFTILLLKNVTTSLGWDLDPTYNRSCKISNSKNMKSPTFCLICQKTLEMQTGRLINLFDFCQPIKATAHTQLINEKARGIL